MSILLTGATGFVGRHLVNYDKIVRIAVRDKNVHRDWTCDRYIIDDLSGKTSWFGAFDGVNAVIHLAALAHSNRFSEEDYHRVNVEGTLHLAKQAVLSGVKRFVFVSSIGVHGSSCGESKFTPVSFCTPHNAYSQSKHEAEIGLLELARATGLEIVIVRPTLVYGKNAPGNFGALVNLVNRSPFLPFGLADNRRDFIAVQNLADLLVTCATHSDASGHIFLASDCETVSIKEFANAIAKGCDKHVAQLPIPVGLLRFVGKLLGQSNKVEQLFGNLEVDSSNTKLVLGWTPPLSMEQAMKLLR
ncbi:TPA: NAD-dependent epimerase/dehydratase family protein [Vibrio alginolyticus]|uniref:NAD-dependent epimerase/dehydratase family protein n=1 Tax=Vibrio alginolyticus TaxID=663 RepID=UPI001BD2C23A|nr:NAD-dependent epimerase/dehydratase family protein [Vibrio alginolyticus]ELB2737845.1 NAD-dependent epimerase/dehydratase family protein [Vibrio alginolyticus]MBS9881889.1 NAD-dependent epimerase/dehydratase family protein [Vibrio alginolyticus]MCR9896956.1 NAD-dependent epimerase/dehydratase family protein [Vibrio alginolyticus]